MLKTHRPTACHPPHVHLHSREDETRALWTPNTYRSDLVKPQSSSGQTVSEPMVNCNQTELLHTLVKPYSQTMVKPWSNRGQAHGQTMFDLSHLMVKPWSNPGREQRFCLKHSQKVSALVGAVLCFNHTVVSSHMQMRSIRSHPTNLELIRCDAQRLGLVPKKTRTKRGGRMKTDIHAGGMKSRSSKCLPLCCNGSCLLRTQHTHVAVRAFCGA